VETGIGGEMRVTDVEVEDGQCGKSGAMPWVAGTGETEALIPKHGVSLWGGERWLCAEGRVTWSRSSSPGPSHPENPAVACSLDRACARYVDFDLAAGDVRAGEIDAISCEGMDFGVFLFHLEATSDAWSDVVDCQNGETTCLAKYWENERSSYCHLKRRTVRWTDSAFSLSCI